MATPAKVVTVSKINKAPDLETHVRLARIDAVEIVEFVDFIPSLGEYGRGYYVPNQPDVIAGILEALVAIAEGEVKV